MKKTLLLLGFALQTAHLTAQPVITSQPVNQTAVGGGNATFSVMATGLGPLTYQWQLNGTNLPNNIITTVAGGGNGGNFGDGGPAVMATLNAPQGVALDTVGNVYIADTGNQCIRKLGTNGVITRIAGNGAAGYSGDNGPATSAMLNRPYGVAVDAAGNLFIADRSNGRVRKVNTNGIISTVASGLGTPTGVAVDAAGNVFIVLSGGHCINKVDTNGVMTTVAGIWGTAGYTGDGGSATNANLYFPFSVAVDNVGNLFIADSDNYVIRKVDTNGIITTIAGNGTSSYTVDGGAATNTGLTSTASVSVDAAGNLFLAESQSNFILKMNTNGIIARVAGNGVGAAAGNPAGDGGMATNATMTSPFCAVTDAAGNLFIAESGNHRIRKVDTNGIITTIAGNGSTTYTGDGGYANGAVLGSPRGVAADAFGNFFIADRSFQRIRKVNANGVISTLAGTGVAGYNLDIGGRSSGSATLNNPNGVTMDSVGNFFIADQSNNRVRKVKTNGFVYTVAGNGTASFSGDGAPATNANLNSPAAVAVDAAGNLLIADQSNQRIRKMDTNGIITTIAGNGTAAYSGDGGAATNASLNNPSGLAVDVIGNIFIADRNNNRIRKVDTNGVITTVAGTNGAAGYSGDGGIAVTNRLSNPTGVAVDYDGNLFIAETNNRIRQVGTNGIITTVAGNGISSFSGDGGLATNASIFRPADVAVDIAGNLFIADQNNLRIRKVLFSNKSYLTLINANINNAGNYSVVVTDSTGSITSSVVTVNLQLPPIKPSFNVSNSTYTFTWNAISNLTYQLQSATNLAAPDWIDLGAPITATNSSAAATDAAGSDEQRFYRVRLLP